MKKIIGVLLCCVAMLSCGGVDLRDGYAPWDKKVFQVKDGNVNLTLPEDFIQTYKHTWHSCNRKMSVSITSEPIEKSEQDFYEYSAEFNVVKDTPVLASSNFEWRFHDGKVGRYYSYTGHAPINIMAVMHYDRQVGHTVVCRSSVESGDNFMSSCWRIMNSVTIE
jgi:hypothetical protein